MLFLSALISFLLQLVSHLATKLFAPKLGLIPRYTVGTICLLLPPSMMYGWDVALPFWVCALASGIAVGGAMVTEEKIARWRDMADELARLKLQSCDANKLLHGVLHATSEKED